MVGGHIMHDVYEDLRHVAQLRLKLCQLHQNQEDPEVRQAINAANQAVGELTALLYKQAFNEQPLQAFLLHLHPE
jgi:hypothetical protein